ncbi:MAG: acetyl-CoA carboxylase carboxyltransferase subunit alpha [Armatimonadetes bacterium]|nr:acetyl-CoA carboxylase carboxyltransferase subunit alpha [Armatimonadota bacterium]
MGGSIEEIERLIAELEEKIELVKRRTQERGEDRSEAIGALETQLQRLLEQTYSDPTGWDRTRLARNPKRPFTLDYLRLAFTDFLELHGDRLHGDDGAIVGGMARLGSQWVTVVGHQKGRDAGERHLRNFGYARPEGYRKALRLMRLSEKVGRPILCLVDTPGADCSVTSEQNGISESIARNLLEMFRLRVPIVIVITGEGGSGGALGIGIGDRVLMFENAIYSVIAPEGCAAIVWRDARRGAEAAEKLGITAQRALEFGIIDEILPEPLGGAHRDYELTARTLKGALERNLASLAAVPVEELLAERYARFRRLGVFLEGAPAPPAGAP